MRNNFGALKLLFLPFYNSNISFFFIASLRARKSDIYMESNKEDEPIKIF